MTASIVKIAAGLAAVALLAGCDGSTGKSNPFQADPVVPDPVTDGTGDNTSDTADDDGDGIVNAEEEDGDRDANGIENILQGAVKSATVSADGTTLDVEISGIDGTPVSATYARAPSLDITGALLNTLYPGNPTPWDPAAIYYTAYSIQDDPLDRLFVALGTERGAVRGDLVHGHGQFNEFIEGALYVRTGDFQMPTTGQVSYDGIYAGYSNLGALNGDTLGAVPATEPVEVRPQEDARIVGKIFLNASFDDNEVNGTIFDRIIIDPADATGASADNRNLPSISLILTDIDSDGQFFGDAQLAVRQSDPAFAGIGASRTDIGDYGGVFAGTNAEAVSGITRFENVDIDPARPGREIEHGIFVLTQCGRDGDEARCDLVQP